MAIGDDHYEENQLVHNHNSHKGQILVEQVKQLYSLAPLGFIATFINSLIVFFVMKEVMPHEKLFLWLGTLWSLIVLRVVLVLWIRKTQLKEEDGPKWATRFIVSLFITGSAWGCIGLLNFSGVSLAHHVFIAFVLGGMAAGASSTFSMHRLGYLAFSVPALTPLTLHFFTMHDAFHYAMGVMLALFGLLLWRIAEHNYAINRTSLLLRFENMEIIQQLREAKERFEGLYGKLKEEVDAKHRAEAELRAQHEHLERIVQERTADLLALNKELEQFAYVASHDLQEPLRMVTSYLKLLKQKYRERLDEKADAYIDFAVDGGIRMQKLIEGLLAYSRFSRGGEFRPVEMNGVFAAAVANLDTVIGESSATVTRDELPTVNGDEIQLQQLLQNLISNAVKYRDREKKPAVHVSAERQQDQWMISVRDNGIGIDPDHFDRIFQIFQRLHSSEEYPGTGIGLASCKKIVERHEGRIWVQSKPGEGSVFFFTLPTATPEKN
ncbi:ATP-binding protein [Geotalea sp. SG265]|uniref:sensor histidine kinase n=1 Tax=Geotalea sp. SG265 TaxID=2922867 RepID=UPI001FAF3500|nr:ATP-binding protein [Geotalea sp. SG265]